MSEDRIEAKKGYIWLDSVDQWRITVIGYNNHRIDQEYKSFKTKWGAKRHIYRTWGKVPIEYIKPIALR